MCMFESLDDQMKRDDNLVNPASARYAVRSVRDGCHDGFRRVEFRCPSDELCGNRSSSSQCPCEYEAAYLVALVEARNW
jgi:hypothetical protein